MGNCGDNIYNLIAKLTKVLMKIKERKWQSNGQNNWAGWHCKNSKNSRIEWPGGLYRGTPSPVTIYTVEWSDRGQEVTHHSVTTTAGIYIQISM